jgi:alpha-tubulin suppressor-like RCC1 family protein
MDEPPIRQIAAADGHYCALRRDGTVHCQGRLFDGEVTSRPTARVEYIPRTAFIATGSCRCAALTDGQAMCWGGRNEFGQHGIGSTGIDPDGEPGFETVAGLHDVVQTAVGNHHACALRRDGTVACWGDNRVGQLGNGTSGTLPAAKGPAPTGTQ